MSNPTPTTEFIYMTLKSSVKLEDPSNVEGKEFLDAISVAWQESGYLRSYWGRTIEKEENVVWVVEWSDVSNSAPTGCLTPFFEPGTQPMSFHVTLTPPLTTDKDALTSAPVTELVVLPFQDTISPEEKTALDNDLITFRNTLLDIKSVKAPQFFSMGWIGRPGPVPHKESPSGGALLTAVVVGWGSKEEHDTVRGTEEFGKAIKPIRERMLPGIEGLGMRHVRFKRDEKAKEE